MTLKEFERYRCLQKEIKLLAIRLERIAGSPDKIVTDTVIGSSRKSPYQEQVILIAGLDQRQKETYERESKKLIRLKCQADSILPKIKNFIAIIPRSDIRLAVDYRYIQGYSWDSVADAIVLPSGEAARKVVERYFEKTL